LPKAALLKLDEKKVRSFSAKKVLVFNKQKHTFFEDKTKREGFKKDDD
jgi:hypothetical protein